MSNLGRERLSTDEENKKSYIIRLGNRYLGNTALVLKKTWEAKDEEAVRNFYLSAVINHHPKLHPNFGLHLLTTSINAENLAKQTSFNINPIESCILGWIHDIGTLISPGDYLRKDIIGNEILTELNVRKEILEKLPDILGILGLSSHIINSIEDVTVIQMMIDVADNLGKYNTDGSLFDVNQMVDYVKAQPRRYVISSEASPSVRAGLNALNKGKQKFAIKLLLDEISYLQEQGVNFDLLKSITWNEVHEEHNQKWLREFSRRYEKHQK